MSGSTYWPTPRPATPAQARRRNVAGNSASAPRKPLHLDGRSRAIQVSLAGSALSICRGSRRLTLPVERISRVIVSGRVHWEASALVVCMQRRLPIVYVDAGGRPLGATLPFTGRSSALEELLHAFLGQTNWRERYDNWLRHERMHVLRRWRGERACGGRPLADDQWREAVRAYAYRDDGQGIGASAGACYAVTLSTLLRAGVRSQYRGWDGRTLALANDLSRIVELSLALERGSIAQALDDCPPLKAASLAAAATEQEALVVEVLARLRRCLADWIEPWP